MWAFGRWTLLVLSLGVTAYGLFAYFALVPGQLVHPDMRATFAAHPVRILAHVGFSAVALAVGPWQFFPALRRRARLHRALGYAYFAGVLGGGVAGLLCAFVAYGGLASQLGFGALAAAWLVSGGAALAAVRRRDFVAHEIWVRRSFALTFAAVTLRLWLPGAVAAGVRFEDFYPAVAWLCWVPNLLFVEWALPAPRSAPR